MDSSTTSTYPAVGGSEGHRKARSASKPPLRAGWRSFLSLILETKPPKGMIVAALLLSIASTAAGLVVPYVTKQFIDGFSLSSLKPIHIILLGGILPPAGVIGSLFQLSAVPSRAACRR